MPVSLDHRPLERRSEATGRWVRVGAIDAGIRIEVGSTGNLLDPARRVPRARHLLARRGGVPTLGSVWPVAEVLTDRVGEFVADLRAELVSAGSPDPDEDLVEIARRAAPVLHPGRDPAHRLPVGGAGTDLVADLLTASYPLLAVPIGHGARPRRIPVPLEPMLRHPDARRAASATLGPRVTRPLVRAIATALLPDEAGRIAWEPLLCALMAADRCGPEQLAAILGTPPARTGTVTFSHTDVERARIMFADTNPRRIAEQLTDSLATEGGMLALATRLARWSALPPRPAVDPDPGEPPAVARARLAAVGRTVDPYDTPITHPESLTRIDGLTVHGYTVCLPRTPNELLQWGVAMDNCLGAYRQAVARDQTRIIGFRSTTTLHFVAEISPARVLRQLEAPHNNPPSPMATRWLVEFLVQHRLMEADGRR